MNSIYCFALQWYLFSVWIGSFSWGLSYSCVKYCVSGHCAVIFFVLCPFSRSPSSVVCPQAHNNELECAHYGAQLSGCACNNSEHVYTTFCGYGRCGPRAACANPADIALSACQNAPFPTCVSACVLLMCCFCVCSEDVCGFCKWSAVVWCEYISILSTNVPEYLSCLCGWGTRTHALDVQTLLPL